MNVTDLTERYVYATVRNLPFGMRKDVARELTGLIEDMLMERCDGLPPTEKDARIVLAELGTPRELANQYSPDKDKCLIGPPYFTQYKTILKIVLAAVVVGMAISGILETMIALSESQMTAMDGFVRALKWIGMILSASVYAFAFVTGLFAFFQWKEIPLSQMADFSYENLPKPPQKQAQIKKGETVAGLALTMLFLVVFLFTPQIICAIVVRDGVREVIPVLNVELVKRLWYFTVAFAAIDTVRNLWRYFEGRYNKKVLWVTGICDALSLVLSVVLLTCYDLTNPQFLALTGGIFAGEDWLTGSMQENIQAFVLCLIAFALLMDFGDTLYRVVRYGGGDKETA